MKGLRFFLQGMIIIIITTLMAAEWLSKTTQSVNVNDIINRFQELSIISCHLRCKSNKKCKSFGMMKNIALGETGECILLARENYSCEINGERIKMYVTNAVSIKYKYI